MRILPALLPVSLIAAVLPVAAAQAQSGPVAAITTYDQGINAIERSGGSLSARTEKFASLVRESYDMPTIAGLVAGPAWAQASAADRSAAITALTRHSAVSLAKNFKGPDATSFTVDPSVIARGGAQVVKVTAGSDVLYYRMRGTKIVDVISGGVSNLSLQRADLAGTISSGGVAAMVKKLAQLDAVK